MFLFGIGVLAFFALAAGLGSSLYKVTGGRRGLSFGVALVAALLVSGALIMMSCIQTLGPGEIGRAFQLNGGRKTLSVGYNFVAPWNRIYRWDVRSQTMNFSEGDAADDAFGAQTQNGDYLTAIASTTVRIDPDRLDEYIERFGNDNIGSNTKIYQIIKNELKRAMETALAQYDTRELMNSKAKASGEARDVAMSYLAQLPFVVETLWFVDFEASAQYEAAIREQAELRMMTDKAALQEALNKQEAQNNKVKADGEAEVKRIAAQAEAVASEIRAQNEADIARIAANRDAEVKKIQVDADAGVITTKAQANAAARVAEDTAQAQGAAAIGKSYQEHPELLEVKRLEIQTQWAQAWNGMMPQFQGLSSFSFADLTDVIKQFVPLQEQAGGAQTEVAGTNP